MPRKPLPTADEILLLAKSGRVSEARQILNELKQKLKWSPTTITQTSGKPAIMKRGRTRVELDENGDWRPVSKANMPTKARPSNQRSARKPAQ